MDWVAVAAKTGYNSASTARCRWGQIRRELLAVESGVPIPKSPSKSRVKKEAVKMDIGGRPNSSSSRVTKSVPVKGRSKSVSTKSNGEVVKGQKARVEKGERMKGESDDVVDKKHYREKSDDTSDEMRIDEYSI